MSLIFLVLDRTVVHLLYFCFISLLAWYTVCLEVICGFSTVTYFTTLHRFERMLGEMLSHLERQPRNKERRVAWLKHIDRLFNVMGLVLLAHFRRIFPLFFKWMHADDDETTLLVRIDCSSLHEGDSFYS